MKKLIALFAILSSTATFAASNKFTFKVNSSGAEIYVCGFNLDKRYRVDETYNGDYVTGSIIQIDDWTGEKEHVADFNSAHGTFSAPMFAGPVQIDFGESAGLATGPNRLGNFSKYLAIDELSFYFSSEKFGNKYSVDVCYNVPLYMDIEQVKFDVHNRVQYRNLNDRDYIGLAGIKADVTVTPYSLSPRLFQALDGKGVYNIDIAQSNVDLHQILDFAPYENTEEYVLKTTYTFSETNGFTDRPHVAHGAEFTLQTDVTPISK